MIMKNFIIIFILAIIAIYTVMYLDTLSVVREVKDVFYGKVESSQLADSPLRRYNITESHPEDDVKSSFLRFSHCIISKMAICGFNIQPKELLTPEYYGSFSPDRAE
jgi:hypothetical protein